MIIKFISRHKFVLGFLCSLSAFPILIAILWFFVFGGNQTVIWQSYQFNIPETESQLIFYWKSINSFLAEYERKVQVISNGRKSSQYPLITNTGGRHHLNFYLIEIDNDNWVRIADRFTECVINLKTLQGYSVGRKFGKTFLGPPQKNENWGYSWRDYKRENLEAHTGETKGIDDPRFKTQGKYIGTLDARESSLRFIPASERPEEHIKTMEEQVEEMDKNFKHQARPDRE